MIGAFHGSLVEAWQELRIHKLRVMLSLIGVAIAVCSLTLVVAMSAMAQDVMRAGYEQMGGREATVSFETEDTSLGADPKAQRDAVAPVFDEFSIGHSTLSAEVEVPFSTDAGTQYAATKLVEPQFESIFSVELVAGRWFAEGDEENLAPVVVVNENVVEEIGADPAQLPTTIALSSGEGRAPVVATIIGVTAGNSWDMLEMRMLALSPAVTQVLESSPHYSMQAWVPAEVSDDLVDQVSARLSASTGASWFGYRSDLFAFGQDPLGILRTILLAIAGLILFLGVMGLVNIALVTVQQRVREIGIRRSFGATGARVFFSVLMESVVATCLAGVLGIAVSVVILRSPTILSFLSDGMAVTPSFPASAAVVGFAVSVGAGALAGLVPAIVATRAHIVDAIRA